MDSLDQSQIAVINSREKRLFVEAPAGYGKTTVMVKKLISDLASNQIPYPKRALALTFSVNAARKMKNDIHKAIAQQKGMRKELVGRVDVMNYHALARQIIMKHGHASLSHGIDVNALTPMNESHVLAFLHNREVPFSEEHNKVLISLSAAVKRADEKLIDSLFEPYCDLVLKTLIQNGCITYNAILLLAIKVPKTTIILAIYTDPCTHTSSLMKRRTPICLVTNCSISLQPNGQQRVCSGTLCNGFTALLVQFRISLKSPARILI